MADTQAAQFSYTLQDELGTKASAAFYALVDPTIAVSALTTAFNSLGVLLSAISGAAILHGEVRIVEAAGEGFTAVPAAGSRVEQTGVFDFGNDVTERKYGSPVAALLNSKISAGQINLADADIAAFTAWLSEAHTLYAFTNNSFQELTALIDAFLSFRKRRKQLFRSSVDIPA